MSDDSAQARYVSLKAQYDSKSVAWEERGGACVSRLGRWRPLLPAPILLISRRQL